MEPHQQRVIEEKSQLEAFITNSTIFVSLPGNEQALLTRQLECAKELSNILGARIATFAD